LPSPLEKSSPQYCIESSHLHAFFSYHSAIPGCSAPSFALSLFFYPLENRHARHHLC
jgi:hypothetical protein